MFASTKVGSTATVVRDSVLFIFHFTFWVCRVYFFLFRQPFSKSCIRSSADQTGCPGRRQPDDSSSLGLQQHVVFLVPSVLRSLPQ